MIIKKSVHAEQQQQLMFWSKCMFWLVIMFKYALKVCKSYTEKKTNDQTLCFVRKKDSLIRDYLAQ